MLRLAKDKRYFILRLINTVADNYVGIQINKGSEKRRSPSRYLYFHIQDIPHMPLKLAHIIRRQLDVGYQIEEEKPITQCLFELDSDGLEPELEKAVGLAANMPKAMRYRVCKIGQHSQCYICCESLSVKERALVWFDEAVLHVACRSCMSGEDGLAA